MREFEGKRTWYMIRHSWWFSIALLCVMLLLLVSVLKMVGSYRYALRHRNERVRELGDLRKKQGELTENVQQLSTPEGLEEVLREKYRATRPGENLVIIIDEAKN
jgi:cell division protein FtsB